MRSAVDYLSDSLASYSVLLWTDKQTKRKQKHNFTRYSVNGLTRWLLTDTIILRYFFEYIFEVLFNVSIFLLCLI